MLRGKCPSAKRRDDLKKHTAVNHPKQPKAVEDGKQGSIRDFFRKSKEHPSTSIAESEPPQPLVEALLPISSIPEPDTLSVSPDQPTCNRWKWRFNHLAHRNCGWRYQLASSLYWKQSVSTDVQMLFGKIKQRWLSLSFRLSFLHDIRKCFRSGCTNASLPIHKWNQNIFSTSEVCLWRGQFYMPNMWTIFSAMLK